MSKFSLDQVTQAIYGQESSHGKADTSKENYAGARGPMQVTRPTFEGLKAQGVIPKDYDHANPQHTKAAGEALVGVLYKKYDGDVSKVAAAYYSGEKAIRDDGSIRNFQDKKNPKAPMTHQYVADIMKRLGTETTQMPAATAEGNPVARASVLASWDEGMPERNPVPGSTKEPKATALAQAPITGSPVITGSGAVPLADQLASEEQILREQTKKREDTGFIEQSRAAFMQNTFAGSLIRNRALSQFEEEHKPVPGFKVDPKELAGMTEDEQSLMMQANSPEKLERIKWEISNTRSDLETVNIKGTGVGIAATLFAGLPEGYLTGMGTMRAFQLSKVGALQLAAQGHKAAAVASAVAENIGGNVALTALQDSFDPYIGGADYAMAVAGGMLGTALTAPSVFGAANKAMAHQSAMRMADNSAAETLALREEATKNLGPAASPEQLQAEVKRLEANRVRQEIASHQASISPDRRLLPESDELRLDVEEVVSSNRPIDNVQEFGDTVRPRYNDTGLLDRRAVMAETDPGWKKNIEEITGGELDYTTASALPNGVHVTASAKTSQSLMPAVEALQSLAKQFLPDAKVVVGGGVSNKAALGEIISAGKVHFIGLSGKDSPAGVLRSAVHELGHAVFHEHAKKIPSQLMQRMQEAHGEFLSSLSRGDIDDAANRRFGLTSPSREASVAGITDPKAKGYIASFDEYTAEQFTKFIEDKVRQGNNVGLTDKVVAMVKDAVQYAMDFFTNAKRQGYIKPDESFAEFFQRVMDRNLAETESIKAAEPEFLDAGLIANFNQTVTTLSNDPVAVKHNIHLMPMGTPTQQAEAKAVLSLYKKASDGQYKVDEKRLSKLMDTAVFQGAQGTANTMLRSKNPVVRMVASELLESAGGAGGRRSTAAIAKHMNERAYLGNTLNEVQDFYRQYRDSQGGTVVQDFFQGKQWEQFNRLVAEEIESRRPGAGAVDSPPAVKQAADALEKAYDRMRTAQTDAKTMGWASLPTTSRGYMPHKMSPEKFINMSTKQAEVLHSALTDQFISISGFDPSFADQLAAKYMDRVRVRAYGGFDAPIGAHQVGAAEVVEEALEQMGMSRPQVLAMMKKYMSGRAGHTKQRLNLDLNAERDLGDGGKFRLLDLFETDQFSLLRSQSQRVAGEVALTRHGIMGKSGLKLVRRAMEFGADSEKATARELEAFDQVAAEFMGDPFGTQSKLADRVMQVNSLARLGGMGFTQFAEAINGIFHVGAIRTLDSVTSMGRLRSEIKALARGEKVDNPIIGSLEDMTGVQFGTDAYKTVFPFDNPSLEYHTYGKDTLGAADRLLRGGSYAQGKLSLWRSIHSTQQRGMAEAIVRKAAEYLKRGDSDTALRDMGFTDDMMARLRKDLPNMAKFEGDKLTDLDLTKATDSEAANDFVQSVHRGVSQIIQGTFIGEQGKWVHDGMMRVMTQFRTFSLTSIEKQWARQVGNVGTAKAMGMMLGAMSVAAPIYMARTYLASIGREDQDDYLEKQLNAAQIARASLNYIAMSGLAGDFLDATTAVTGVGKVTGGRTGVGSEFVGNVVAPAAGMVDDLWRGMQNTKEGTDPHELLKALPFSRLPWMIPAINGLAD